MSHILGKGLLLKGDTYHQSLLASVASECNQAYPHILFLISSETFEMAKILEPYILTFLIYIFPVKL